jgi:group II intron reverse transcriptase/maturase
MTRGSTRETVDGMNLQKIHKIIELLKHERYKWTPVRRTEIPKPNGKTRPLGIPTWSDKLVQEVPRSLLEPYYEQRFSPNSHGFRPERSCHSALFQIRKRWRGIIWFIEGDIKGAFDNVDHSILLKIIRRDIQDGRLINLIEGLLKAGYMEDWRYHDSPSGTPQGGIISPLLFNIYLTDLDRFIEDTLIPTYTRGKKRKIDPAYKRISNRIAYARKAENFDEVKRLKRERRTMTSMMPCDPDYRRLFYVRYADDFLLGFAGPKNEADEIRQRIGEFLEQKLKLTLSVEKTLITHANDGKAKFLGYEIMIVKEGNLLDKSGRRSTNGGITLLMPHKVITKYKGLYSKGGKVIHRAELLVDTDYTIIQRYQSVLVGIYNFYCMAQNVSKRMQRIKWILETSLLKTLASKFKCKVAEIIRRYKVVGAEPAMYQIVIQRPDKDPLVATFGGVQFRRIPEGLGTTDIPIELAWFKPASRRSEVVQRLLAGKCELCGKDDEPVSVHHIRKLADIDRPGRRPKTVWEHIMSARKRKTLVTCGDCHTAVHAGQHDGPRL